MTATRTWSEVAVVGSVNLDTVLRVERLPAPGETVLAREQQLQLGGKGSNQAVAAARLGRRTALVARVGEDPAGERILAQLASEGIALDHVARTPRTATGSATVLLDDAGENSIVVAAGANAALTAADVDAAAELLGHAAVTLIQFEVPLAAARRAAALAGGAVVLNPSPVRPLDAELLGRVDVLVVNRVELDALAGAPAAGQAPAPAHPDAIGARAATIAGPSAVVTTLGADGAVLARQGVVEHVEGVTAAAIDTTGAGDAFCGALADALARRVELADAVRWANAAAAIATTRIGAQSALASAAEVRARTPAQP